MVNQIDKFLFDKYNTYYGHKNEKLITNNFSEWLRSKNLQAINAGEGVQNLTFDIYIFPCIQLF